jgi:3-oxoacyl-ACP reductase-like protein
VKCWAPGAVYCDPLAHVTGIDALVEHIGKTQNDLTGGRVEVTGKAIRHHDSAYFPWAVQDVAGETVMTGFDVVQLDEQDRITRLTGFFND